MDDVLNAWIKNGSKASDTYKYWKELYKIKTIEDEVSKRALVEARKNTKWIIYRYYWCPLAWGNLVEWLLTQNPTWFLKWAVMKWINAYNKYLNSPDTQIRNLFDLVEKTNNPWLLSNAWNVVRSELQKTAPAVATVYPWMVWWEVAVLSNWQKS